MLCYCLFIFIRTCKSSLAQFPSRHINSQPLFASGLMVLLSVAFCKLFFFLTAWSFWVSRNMPSHTALLVTFMKMNSAITGFVISGLRHFGTTSNYIPELPRAQPSAKAPHSCRRSQTAPEFLFLNPVAGEYYRCPATDYLTSTVHLSMAHDSPTCSGLEHKQRHQKSMTWSNRIIGLNWICVPLQQREANAERLTALARGCGPAPCKTRKRSDFNCHQDEIKPAIVCLQVTSCFYLSQEGVSALFPKNSRMLTNEFSKRPYIESYSFFSFQ